MHPKYFFAFMPLLKRGWSLRKYTLKYILNENRFLNIKEKNQGNQNFIFAALKTQSLYLVLQGNNNEISFMKVL